MITDELLLENGYKIYVADLNCGDCLFQKRIRNEKGQTRYFINIYKYKHTDRPNDYEVDLQFEKDNYTMDITLFGLKKMTLEEIEKEVYRIWYGLDCEYYSEVE